MPPGDYAIIEGDQGAQADGRASGPATSPHLDLAPDLDPGDLLAFGARQGYPTLPFKPGISIARGEAAWRTFTDTADADTLRRAVEMTRNAAATIATLGPPPDGLVAARRPPAPYAQVGLTLLHVGDSVAVLNALPPGSAGLVGGSPPYALGKDYGTASDTQTYEERLDWLGTVSKPAWRVLEEGGRFWLNLPFDTNLQFDPEGRKRSSKQPVLADVTHLLVREQGWTNNALIVWDEGNVSRRTAWGSYARPTDPWMILASEAILVLSKGPRKREARGRTWDVSPKEFQDWTLARWQFPGESARRIGHPAPFPIELPHRVIKLYSFKEDLVIDPWGGSGTTNVAASRLGRRNVYIDLNPDFAELAQARLEREPQSGARLHEYCGGGDEGEVGCRPRKGGRSARERR